MSARALLCATQKMFYDSKHEQFTNPTPGADLRRRRPRGRARLSRAVDSQGFLARRGWLRRVLACAAALCAVAPAAAQGTPDMERKIKAAFLYKFLDYTEFPAAAFAGASAPLVIGVVGADELAAELSRIVARRNVQSRTVTVKTFRDNEVPAGVHLLFVAGSDAARVRGVLKSVRPAPVLLVTEAENGLQQGSVINFKVVEERVRFDVSLEAADKNSIKLSSRLLTVANHVHKGTP